MGEAEFAAESNRIGSSAESRTLFFNLRDNYKWEISAVVFEAKLFSNSLKKHIYP